MISPLANKLSHSALLKAVTYHPETGLFTWNGRPSNRCSIKPPGSHAHSGYIRLTIGAKRFYAHRLAWFYVYGAWPNGVIDHINHNPSDNRIANLREATHTENMRNSKLRKNNVSGITGVYLHSPGRWRARITVNRRGVHLGLFDSKRDAEQAYREAAARFHGAFAAAPSGAC